MLRLEWLELPKDRTLEELEELKEEWQIRLGLCDVGIRLVKVKSWKECNVHRITECLFLINACDERTLLHEILHVLLITKKHDILSGLKPEWTPFFKDSVILNRYDEKFIFILVNALLRLKYQSP